MDTSYIMSEQHMLCKKLYWIQIILTLLHEQSNLLDVKHVMQEQHHPLDQDIYSWI